MTKEQKKKKKSKPNIVLVKKGNRAIQVKPKKKSTKNEKEQLYRPKTSYKKKRKKQKSLKSNVNIQKAENTKTLKTREKKPTKIIIYKILRKKTQHVMHHEKLPQKNPEMKSSPFRQLMASR